MIDICEKQLKKMEKTAFRVLPGLLERPILRLNDLNESQTFTSAASHGASPQIKVACCEEV